MTQIFSAGGGHVMEYGSVFLTPTIQIERIVTIHYYEYGSHYHFSGESHDFWEFLCVDKGELNVTAGDRDYALSRNDIIFHKPNEFHCLSANHKVAPNLVVIAFFCDSPQMDFFRDKLLSIDNFERGLLAQIILEARNVFLDPLDDPMLKQMHKREVIPPGAEQLISLNLELLLLHLLRRYSLPMDLPVAKETIRQKNSDELYHRVVEYLTLHLNEQLTLDDIAKGSLTGKSQLQHLIREQKGCGVIELFCRMKIDQAKLLIRENSLNFTEIANTLGYSSIHYFSRQFKKITGMTPSEYSGSIKKMIEEDM